MLGNIIDPLLSKLLLKIRRQKMKLFIAGATGILGRRVVQRRVDDPRRLELGGGVRERGPHHGPRVGAGGGHSSWASKKAEKPKVKNTDIHPARIASLRGWCTCIFQVPTQELDVLVGNDFTAGLAYRAAELRGPTRELGLSLGDRACLALGLSLGSPILTGDKAWIEVDLGVEIELARP